MRTLAAAAMAALALASCGTSAKKRAPRFTPVAEADVGRLAPEQMGPVQAARATQAEAKDAVSRARLRLSEAHYEDGYAQADRTQAQADAQRAAAELKAAQDSGDPGMLARAEERTQAAKLRAEAADAHQDYARKVLAAWEAQVAADEARVALADAQVERAKLEALTQADIPASSKYDAKPFDERVANARRAEEAAQGRLRDRSREATQARDRWRSLTERYEARAKSLGGPIDRATGSGR